MTEYFIDVKGGLGMNISLARVAQNLIKKGYKISVLSPYWDVFLAAGIDVYKPEEIRDFIFDAKDRDAKIIEHRIYDMSDFIYKRMNYLDAWLKLMELPEDTVTEEGYEHLELDPVKYFPQLQAQLEEINKVIGDDYALVQFCGGQSPLDVPQDGDWSKKIYDYQNEPLKRHYPTEKAQELVDKYLKAHPGRKIVQYALPNEPLLNGCEHFTVPYLVYYELAKNAKEAITIDSSLQHLITGLCPVNVIWGHSLPENFGYECNHNIVQKCRRDDILYFTALGASGAKIDYIEPDKLMEYIR